MIWPSGKRFAFTVFDDPDGQSLETSERVYGFLAETGFRTTKAVWPIGPSKEANSGGATCACEPYRRHTLALQADGFEIAYHLAGPQSSTRQESIQGLERFREFFGAPPASMANHYNREALYWGPDRLSGWRRSMYQLATLEHNSDRFSGHIEGDAHFWGDICRSQIRYCRNFVFREINTLRACPQMPYHDPLRPWVNQWFASTEGAKVHHVHPLRTRLCSRRSAQAALSGVDAAARQKKWLVCSGHNVAGSHPAEPEYRDCLNRDGTERSRMALAVPETGSWRVLG